MRLLKITGLVMLGLAVLFVAVGLALPSGWSVERTVAIAAPAEAIQPFLETPRQWPVWSAWTDAEYPDMKVDFDGPERGAGAAWSWRGESSGAGRLEITRAAPGSGIEYRLVFEDFPPIDGAMRLAPAEAGTTLVWTMAGDVGGNLLARYLAPFMDDMMATELDEGLAKLKGLAEARAREPAPVPAAADVAAEPEAAEPVAE